MFRLLERSSTLLSTRSTSTLRSARSVMASTQSRRRMSSVANQATLSADELEFLKNNGYLVRRQFVTEDTCALLENRINQLIDQFDPETSSSIFQSHEEEKPQDDEYFLNSGDQIRFFWEADAFNKDGSLAYPKRECINKVGHALHSKDGIFKEYVTKNLQSLTKPLFKQAVPLQSMYICKSGRTGGEVLPHQDSTFLHTTPMSCYGFWLSIHKADQHNGCLWAIPSPSQPLYKRFHRTQLNQDQNQQTQNDATILEMTPYDTTADYPTEGGVPLETDIGDLVILHGTNIHWSNANQSNKSRHSFMLHLVDGACEYSPDNWLQYPDGKPFPTFDTL